MEDYVKTGEDKNFTYYRNDSEVLSGDGEELPYEQIVNKKEDFTVKILDKVIVIKKRSFNRIIILSECIPEEQLIFGLYKTELHGKTSGQINISTQPIGLDGLRGAEPKTFSNNIDPLSGETVGTGNNNDININVNKEKEDITNIPLDKRTSFILNEKIKEKVNQEIEFKNCSFPLSTNDSGEIKKILCSFLNAEGGRLYLGINKKNEVKGMTLNYKKRDTLRNDLINLVYDFYPKCRVDKIYVYFLPIKDNKNNFIPKIYVIKIRVYPGDKAFLYSMTKLGYLSYIRRKEECYELQPQEIYDEIIRRDELKYKKDNENNIIIKEKDPEPEVNQQDLENVDDEIPIFVNENKPAKKSNTKQKKKNKIIVKISNIDKDVETNDINRFFNNCNCSSRKILKGHGYLYFSNKNDAEECITKYDGKQIGNKFIKLNIINNEE